MNDVDAMQETIKRARRRTHGALLRAQVLQACKQPGASIAAIARLHDLNANVVHRWRAQEREAVSTQPVDTVAPADVPRGFLAVKVQEEVPTPSEQIRIELKRGNASAVVHWPVTSAAACATWLREWLR